jgi:hypothetical protein
MNILPNSRLARQSFLSVKNVSKITGLDKKAVNEIKKWNSSHGAANIRRKDFGLTIFFLIISLYHLKIMGIAITGGALFFMDFIDFA